MSAFSFPTLLVRALPLLAAAASAAAADATPSELAPFQARYSVVYHGMNAGTSTMTLTHADGELWSYRSSSSPRGLFRLFLPDQITQRSDMRISAEAVQPLKFSAGESDDAPDKKTSLSFDWQAMRVTGSDEQQAVDIKLEPGVQDDLSVQVLLMRELIGGREPDTFKTLGHHGVDRHRYVRQGTATLKTPLGDLATIIYRSERIGSSRSSLFWCAPALGYLPVRAQQSKGDKVEFVMDLIGYQRS